MKKIIVMLCFVFVFAGCSKNRPVTNTILMVMPDVNFYDPEYTIPREALENLGYQITVANESGQTSVGIEKLEVKADLALKDAKESDYDSLVLVGGYGSESLFDNKDLIRLSTRFHKSGKVIGAQCFTPVVLAQAGLLDGKQATCWTSQAAKLESYGVTFTGEIIESSGIILTAMAGSNENIEIFTEAYIGLLKNGVIQKKKQQNLQDTAIEINKEETKFNIVHNGKERSGKMFVPSTYNKEKSYSLVFGLHGSGGNGAGFQGSGFDVEAERLGFIMVYPDGVGGHWDITPGYKSANDDLGFFVKLIDELSGKYNIDEKRIYATGHSMGAMMAYRLAYELGDTFAAVAPVAGMLQKSPKKIADGKVSLLHIHALDDDVVDLEGEKVPNSYSFDETINIWAEHNKLKNSPITEELTGGIKRSLWLDADGTISVGYYLMPSGGHGWLQRASGIISEFFYTHPARKNKIGFNVFDIPHHKTNTSPIFIKPTIESPEDISRVVLSANGKTVAETSTSPFSFQFKPELNNNYNLEMTAYLKDGDVILSSSSVDVLVCAPGIAVKSLVTTSSVEKESLSGELAVDGKLETRWASGFSDDQYIQLDLGDEVTIKGVILIWETAYGKEYSIDTSKDKKNWKSVYVQSDGKGRTECITFPSVKAQYIRLKGIKRGTPYGYSLHEFLVF